MVSSSQRSKSKCNVTFFLTCTGGVGSAIFFATAETAAGLARGFGVGGLGEYEVGIDGDELEGIGELDTEEVPNLASLLRRIFGRELVSFFAQNGIQAAILRGLHRLEVLAHLLECRT